MPKVTTSVRLEAALRSELATAASREGVSVTDLIERYLAEGLTSSRYPGIVFRGGPAGRRAALAGGPDVWEVVATLKGVEGPEAQRVRVVADLLGLHEREVLVALDYASAHGPEVEARIEANEAALVEAERVAVERSRLLA